MNAVFRRLPLSYKLLLIAVIPLAFIGFLTWQVYREKTENISMVRGYINRVGQIGDISNLIHKLQQEQKLSFDISRQKGSAAKLRQARAQTDSIVQILSLSNDYVLRGFKDYTSLRNLQTTRNRMDSGLAATDQVIHFYSNTIFRLNTLSSTPFGSQQIFEHIYGDIRSQKILMEMITYVGIIRTNIYNVLTTKLYMTETLLGTVGAYDVLKSYQTELKYKASPATLRLFDSLNTNTGLQPTLGYIDYLFTNLKFDDRYTPEQWWTISENGLQELSLLREIIFNQVTDNLAAVYNDEQRKRDNTVVWLLVIWLIVLGFVAYTLLVITKMLTELKIGAEQIAAGGTGVQFNIASNDAIGSLASSICKIDENNKQLTSAAEEIGKGNFDVPVITRSRKDILAMAIATMKEKLKFSIVALEKNEEQFRTLADLMPQIVWITNESGEVQYFNKQWYEYAGHEPMSAVMHPLDFVVAKKAWAKAVYDQESYSIEMRLLNSTSKQYEWFLVRASAIRDTDGKITRWFGTSTNIHERKVLSEELELLVEQRTLELKRSNDDLLQFAHVASHDMKEPLRKIRFFSDRLLREPAENGTDKSRVLAQKINIAAERLTNLIEGILEFSSIKGAEGSLEPVNLEILVQQIITDLEITIQSKGGRVSYCNLPVIKGIPILLNQLFYNLVVNALKFSKQDIPPIINIRAKWISANDEGASAFFKGEDYMQIEVEDNGIGIGEGMQTRIFEVFSRLNPREKYEGTGLGLALCKKIMERHEGIIYVKSEEGKGSCFFLLFNKLLVVEDRVAPIELTGAIQRQ